MKSTTPKEIAIFISLFTSVVTGVILVVTFDFDRQNFYLTVILSCLSLFLVTYLFCFFLTNYNML